MKITNNHQWWIQGGLLMALVLLLGALAFRPPAAAQRKAVVVELFTSEGCSSCPPADELLRRFARERSSNGAEIIPLGFHVDYWDHQGWLDRFSSAAYTARQEKYAAQFRIEGPYTPQMVVDGQTEFVGNDGNRAEDAIARAAARPQAADLQLTWTAPDKLQVSAAASSNITGDVRLAVAEDNLSSNVAGGENGGRKLYHSAVVREFRLLGRLQEGKFQTAVSLKPQKDWKIDDLHVVAFVQNASTGSIEGAVSIPWRSSLSAGR